MMGGELIAVSPSGLSGDKGVKISFTIKVYSNRRKDKNLQNEDIKSFRSD